jgi:protocatechuate 3,4-dioxygenase beta subunit
MRRFSSRATLVLCAGLLAGPLIAGALAGRVTDAEGRAVSGARVAAYAFQTPERGLLERTRGADPTPLSETKTDSNGRFLVSTAKPASDMSVRIFPAGLPSVEVEGPFNLNGENDELEVLLPAAEAFSGRVFDEAGKPLKGVLVRAGVDPSAAEGDGVPFDESRSDADGSFLLKAAPAGSLSINAYLPGFAPASLFRSRSKNPERIVVKRGGRIEGSVVDPAGNPVAGAIVLAGGVAAETDSAGRYELSGVLEGLASVEVVWKDDLAARRGGIRVRKGDVARADLVLARSAAIAGTVLDEKTRRPLAGARVFASEARTPWAPADAPRNATTDARGRFRIAGLGARDYMVIVSRKDCVRSAIPGVLAGIAPPASANFALRRTATISGRVSDELGQPVSGARVSLLPPAGRKALLAGRWTSAKPATASGGSGAFRLRGVPPGAAVSIQAAKPGFVPARRDGISPAGESAKGIVLVLRRGFEARGRVVNEQEEPIAGAEVRLTRNERLDGGSFFFSSDSGGGRLAATSDRDGRFVAGSLQEGQYSARFSREGFATKTATFEVKDEGVTEWPAVVLRASVPIAGVVRNGKGEPIDGARVFSFDSGGGGGSDSATSDAEGRFRQDGYQEGSTVTLIVSAEGYARLRTSVKAPGTGVSLVLSTAGTLRGRVEDGDTRRPLEAFSVRWSTLRSASIQTSSGRDFQAPDGFFELPDVGATKVELTASAPGYLAGQLTAVEVGEGEVKEGIVLSIKKGKTVSGRVLDPLTRSGVPNATVAWQEEGAGERGIGFASSPAGSFAVIPNSTTTDADGRFQYTGVPAGKLVFRAMHQDYLEATKTLDTASESALELVLSVGGTIDGQVRAGDGRSPAPGVPVSLQEQGSSPAAWSGDETRSDASGRFEFTHLKEGRYRVAARGPGGRSPSRDVVLAPDQHLGDVLLELAGGTLILGRVTGLPPNQVSSVRVTAASKDFFDSVSVGEDGQFLLRGAPPGIVSLSARTTGVSGRAVSRTIEVPEGDAEVPVEMAFEGSSRLSGRVERGGKGIPGLWLSAVPNPPSSGNVRGSAQTDADGRYAMEGLTDGAYQLSVSGENVRLTRMVAVSGESSADVVLGGVSLTGVISDAASGEPVANVVVRAQTAATTAVYDAPSAYTDSRGYYALENLDPGSYQVTAQRSGYEQKTQDVRLADSPQELDIRLSRGAGLSIRAADGMTGLPARGVSVLVFSLSRAIVYQGNVSLDSAGQGEIPSLAPGRYSLYVFATGYASRALSAVEVPSPTLSVLMTPGGRLELRSEAPFSGRIFDAAGAPYLSSPWRIDGLVSVSPPAAIWENFPPGSYQLVVNGPGGERSFPFAVAEGRTTTLDMK